MRAFCRIIAPGHKMEWRVCLPLIITLSTCVPTNTPKLIQSSFSEQQQGRPLSCFLFLGWPGSWDSYRWTSTLSSSNTSLLYATPHRYYTPPPHPLPQYFLTHSRAFRMHCQAIACSIDSEIQLFSDSTFRAIRKIKIKQFIAGWCRIMMIRNWPSMTISS